MEANDRERVAYMDSGLNKHKPIFKNYIQNNTSIRRKDLNVSNLKTQREKD